MKFKLWLFFFILFFINHNLFADRLVVTGKPTLLKEHPGFYTFPKSYFYTTERGYHFVRMGEVNRVCFLAPQSQYKQLDWVAINIEENDKKFLWYCYRYDLRFFQNGLLDKARSVNT